MISNLFNLRTRDLPPGSKYYYSRLIGDQKLIYERLSSGIIDISNKIKMPMRPINELSMLFQYILLDNPMLFYTKTFSQSNDMYKSSSIIIPDYNMPRQSIMEYTENIYNHLKNFDSHKTNKSDYEKVIYVHDYFLNIFKYDFNFNPYSFTVLGLVLNNTGVCEGIAKYAKLIFDYIGIKSLIVLGKAKNPAFEDKMENHAWNIVKVDGNSYHLDITFDMTIKDKNNRYDYFLINDEDIKKDHIITDKVPACTSRGKDYYSINKMTVNNMSELDLYIKKAITQGNKNIVVKIMNVKFSDSIVNNIVNNAQRHYVNIVKKSVSTSISYNLTQMIFEINFK